MKLNIINLIVLSLVFGGVTYAQEKGGCDICGPSGTSMNYANGNYSITSGANNYTYGMCSAAIGNSTKAYGGTSFAIGSFVRANATNAVVIGCGLGDTDAKALINAKQNSLMIGFNSKRPTLFVSTSLGGETTGKIGIGNVINPVAKLHLRSDANEDAGLVLETSNLVSKSAYIQLYDANNRISVSKDGMGINAKEKMDIFVNGRGLSLNKDRITMSGKVGINADNTFIGDYNYALAVNGGVLTSEVYVKEVGEWHDYVFKKDYKLMSLDDLNNYIDANGFLPDMPSEADVLENGFNLAEMDGMLLKKIEELTLYVIELQKQLQEQQEEMLMLQDCINKK